MDPTQLAHHGEAPTRSETPAFSVVVPVYNSVESLPELVERLERVFRETMHETYEIIMVDDASPNPDTWPTLLNLLESHSGVVAIQLARNFGRHAAVLCGFHESRGRWIITMDDDLEHRPEDIPALAAERAHDVVIGAFQRKHHSGFKRISSRIKGWFDYKLAGKPKHIVTSPFMLIRDHVVRAAIGIRSPYPFVAALLFFVTRDIVNVQTHHDPRKYGTTHFTLRKMVQVFAVLMLHNSSFLLNSVVAVGAAVSLLSLGYGTWVVINSLIVGTSVPGWASLTAIVSFQGGLILLSLGVIGEYLVRILNGVENRPAYTVRVPRRVGATPS